MKCKQLGVLVSSGSCRIYIKPVGSLLEPQSLLEPCADLHKYCFKTLKGSEV
jgi:hypothetical protein